MGVEPTSAVLAVYCGLLLGVSAARRLSRSAFGGQANPGLGFSTPAVTEKVLNRISLMRGDIFSEYSEGRAESDSQGVLGGDCGPTLLTDIFSVSITIRGVLRICL